ncbi:MAG TPA: TonB-dependent receptor [Cytophagales bacterium]|nr:TonB-dependent receptor [Cytophagales bacterium]
MIKIFWALSLIFLLASPLLAQQVNVTGKVISLEDSTGLPGVSVVVKGTLSGTVTDIDGTYSIEASPEASLVFTYIGFITQEVKINNQSNIDLVLKPNVTQLTEVVVTGYTTQQKKNVISSISSVSTESFKDMPVMGIDQALQGQAPGVQVTQSSGTPGGGIKVVIRGNTSVSASNMPLFILDGVPVEIGALSSIGFGGQNDNALALINPNDYEDIELLKDAAAKAMYGSRGANGVVVLTSKRGKKNSKTRFNAEAQRGLINITRKPELLNSTELLELQREAVVNSGRDPDELGLIEGVTDGINTDWVEEVLRTGIFEQYQLSATGGGDKTSFYISGNYRNEEGVQVNNGFERYSATLNLDHTSSDRLTFGNSFTISRAKNNRVKGDNYLDAVYSAALQALPYNSAFDEQGKLIGYGSPGFSPRNGNPLVNAVAPRYDVYTTKILGNVYAKYKILQGLNFRTQVSGDYNSVIEDQYQPTSTIIGGNPDYAGGKGYGISAASSFITLINSNLLTFDKKIGEHNVDVLLGAEILQRVERGNYVEGRMFPSDDFSYIGSAGIVDAGSSYIVKNGLLSFFGEIKYNFREKYLISIGAREDGSSRFGKGRKFGFFPAIAAGWILSEESFLKDYNFLTLLKLKASWGYSGNEGIGDFEFLGRWSATTYNGASGVSPSRIDNPNLQWERTEETNVGLDVSLFNARINLIVEGYYNLTDKLLFDQPVPATTGFSTVKGNVGNLRNRGIEVGINIINIDKVVNWSTSINLSRNENEVVRLVDDKPLFRGYQGNGVNGTSVIKEGEPLGSFWGLRFLGVDPATGEAIYDDINGDGSITPDDGTIVGSAQPDFIGSFINNVSYKGFDLSLFFQFSYGNDILNFSNTELLNAGQNINTNQSREALKRWREPGDITSVPRYEFENSYNNRTSSRFIEDGSYLRLKNLTIGYTLPSKYTKRIKVSSTRIFCSGSNLWTYTNYSGGDPEVSTLDGSTSAQGTDLFTLPQVSTLMIGLTVGF